MNRTELILRVAFELNLEKEFVRDVIQEYENAIYDAVNSGEDVTLADFLTFKIKLSGGTHRWSIQAQDKIFVPLKYKLFVKPTGKLKTSIESQNVSKRERQLHAKQHREAELQDEQSGT